MSRRHYPPEKRLQTDLGRLKDQLAQARAVIAWQAALIERAGIDVTPLIEHAEDRVVRPEGSRAC